MAVLLFNPTLKDNNGTLNSNLGDIIITQAVMAEMNRIFPGEEVISISSHAQPGDAEKAKIKRARHRIVGGTNVLASDMRNCRQWGIPGRLLARHPAVLCGVGWQHYQPPVKFFTKVLLNFALSRSYTHSVRDAYTKKSSPPAAFGMSSIRRAHAVGTGRAEEGRERAKTGEKRFAHADGLSERPGSGQAARVLFGPPVRNNLLLAPKARWI